MDGVDASVFEHLGSLLPGDGAPGAFPAPISVRLYLRILSPRKVGGDAILVDNADAIGILCYLCKLVDTFSGEFHAGVNTKRVSPTDALLCDVLALHLAKHVAQHVRETRQLLAEDGIQEVLVGMLEEELRSFAGYAVMQAK